MISPSTVISEMKLLFLFINAMESWMLIISYNHYICKFLDLNGDSKFKSVQLEKDIAQNLTCFKGSQNASIKWIKVNSLIKN
jgi:hypothetical protein